MSAGELALLDAFLAEADGPIRPRLFSVNGDLWTVASDRFSLLATEENLLKGDSPMDQPAWINELLLVSVIDQCVPVDQLRSWCEKKHRAFGGVSCAARLLGVFFDTEKLIRILAAWFPAEGFVRVQAASDRPCLLFVWEKHRALLMGLRPIPDFDELLCDWPPPAPPASSEGA